jgi:hypothetical protein
MKKSFFLILVILTLIQYDGLGQKRKDRNAVKTDTVSMDSLEYSLIVLDPGFDTWLATKPPMNFYSKEYYEVKNRIYVTEWNIRYRTLGRTGLYETYIDYDPKIDYGLELNYKLYYYFRYFEETNNVTLYPHGP